MGISVDWQDAALAMAGVIGGCVAVVHGILTQRLMVRPIQELTRGDARFRGSVGRLVPGLLHFSTLAWFLGGVALIAVTRFGQDARLATGLCVGGLYLYGESLGDTWPPSGLGALHARACSDLSRRGAVGAAP